MKILLIEDCENKIHQISECIAHNLCGQKYEIFQENNLECARRRIIGDTFDLIIFDFFLPINKSSPHEVDVSSDLIAEFTMSRNYQTETIAITKFELDQIENIELFNSSGVTVVSFINDNGDWSRSLDLKINRIKDNVNYDFLIFCALSKERNAYAKTDAEVGELKILKGLDCQEIRFSGFNGLCLIPTRMGLVSMAILAAKAIEAFQPKIVAMSGICAGVNGNSKLLDLIVGELCWEYQTGKFKDNEFKQEPYQAALNSHLAIELRQFSQKEGTISKIKQGLYDSELKDSDILIEPISSGSAVIASEQKMNEIGLQHRKMAGLEMEMYSLYEAASQSLSQPLYFGAKSVVDLGDSSKGDQFHTSASIISARFVVDFLKTKLSAMSVAHK